MVGRASIAARPSMVGRVIWPGRASMVGRVMWPDSRQVSVMHTGRRTDTLREPTAAGARVPLAEIRAG